MTKLIPLSLELAQLEKNYLFSLVSAKKAQYKNENTLDLGVGDVSKPLNKVVAQAIIDATTEMSEKVFGYGPECGYPFLKQAIIQSSPAYSQFSEDEIFVNDGIISDMARFPLQFAPDITLAIQDPCFPPYFENLKFLGRFKTNTVLIPCLEENNFIPNLPEERVDLIYLCSPHNPTGSALTREQLSKWVNYAKSNGSIILFDSAYQAFVTDDDVPSSIYEIEGAELVAIEFCSFSKSAGFTGLRCGYFVCPKGIEIDANGKRHKFLPYVEHSKSISTNGVAYPIQKGAEAALTKKAQDEIRQDIESYMRSAKQLKLGLQAAGFTVFGGINCPYIWFKVPTEQTSVQFFETLLKEYDIVSVPGSGFGQFGEGYVRLSGFIDEQKAKLALQRLRAVCK
ncbi:MAG: LL-diaminopimelate aminotransferase [Rhabdochlamydiaceae bacterium]|nr:LL-diaminopimelate aminotransferase [Candidatus Amphrikana amoebophyrae]